MTRQRYSVRPKRQGGLLERQVCGLCGAAFYRPQYVFPLVNVVPVCRACTAPRFASPPTPSSCSLEGSDWAADQHKGPDQ